MKVYELERTQFASNCYLLTADGKNAVAIDPGEESDATMSERYGLKVQFVLLTHGHFDHIRGCSAFSKRGAKICCLAGEEVLACGSGNVAALFGERIAPFQVDSTFLDGDTFTLCGIRFKVIATPGHTAGSCCYEVDGKLFTGDTLFCGSFGRTDLPTGSMSAMRNSLKKLAALSGDYEVYPGHGEKTTLDSERRAYL